MTDLNELQNNIVYKLIVLNNLQDRYNWNEMYIIIAQIMILIV